MKLHRLIAAMVIALSSLSANADVFDFSYTFGTGDVVSGSLSGTQNGNYIESVSDVSVFFNGNPFSGNHNLYQPYSFIEGCCFSFGAGVVSFDGNLNNFYFSDAAPNSPATNTFYMNGTDQDNYWTGDQSPLRYATVYVGSSVFSDVTANSPTYPGANGNFDANKWTLVASAVPEPETFGIMLAGLSFIGFMSSRRKQKAA